MNAHVPDTPARILVIDDDRVIRMVVREALESAGHVVLESGEPEEGIELATERAPDLVILDIMLPRMDGLAVLVRLRECGVTSRVLVFSATGSRNAETARELGADDYLAKPFELEDLVAAVNRLLGADGTGAGADAAA